MKRPKPEPVQVIKERRDAALRALTEAVPYIRFLGMSFDRRGDELTAILPHCEEVVFAESAHMFPYEQPDEFTAALAGFLDRC